jgi:DNA-binding Lrp family transcriptional regulator
VNLTEPQKQVLAFLQDEFPLVLRPFAGCSGMGEAGCLQVVGELMQMGVLKRIAAVLNHYRLGFSVNAMVCAEVSSERIEKAGGVLASFRQVSHCYQRRTFPGWPYNLFAMVHCRSEEELNAWIQEARDAVGVSDLAVLRTVREIKKEPVRISFT